MNGIFPTSSEWKRGIRYAIVFLTLGLCVWKAGALITGLLPFVIAFAIAEAIEPVVRPLSARFGRGWSALFIILILLGIGWVLATWATVALISAIVNFLDDFPHYRETVVQFIQDVTDQVMTVFANLPQEITQWVTENTSQLAEGIEQVLYTLGRTLVSLLLAVPSILTAGLLIPLATFFMSKDLPTVRKLLWSMIPRTDRGRVGTVIGDLWMAALNYLRAVAVLVSFTTVVTISGLWIIGVDNWFAAGLLIGLLDFLPVVGPTLAFVPWILYLVIVGNVPHALSLLIVYALAVGLRSLIEAKVIGDSMGLHPLAILMAMYIGALLIGIKGAFLGPVTLLLAKAIYTAWKKVEPTS